MKHTYSLPFGLVIKTATSLELEKVMGSGSGEIVNGFDRDDSISDEALDALESLILAHACAGIDVGSPAYLEGIETAMDALSNN